MTLANTKPDLTVWENRWDSLNTMLDNLKLDFEKRRVDHPKIPILLDLVNRLQAFAVSQFNFFYDGFGLQNFYQLEEMKPKSPDLPKYYPIEYVFRATLDQIAHDLEIIHRAAQQRLSGTVEMRQTLDKADNYGQAVLQPMMPDLIDNNAIVVTYFEKSASIRGIPYAPVALIGIPATCASVPQDFLAIPHEIGHYVYWHGQVVTAGSSKEPISLTFENALPQDPSWVRRWTEEIFADVYGGLVGGPLIALDFQDLQLEHSGEEFTTDKEVEDHPVPILRPEIYIKVLDQIETRTPQLGAALRNRWDMLRQKRSAGDGFELANGQEKKLADAISLGPGLSDLRPVDRVIMEALELLPVDEIVAGGSDLFDLNSTVTNAIINRPDLLDKIALHYVNADPPVSSGGNLSEPEVRSLYTEFGAALESKFGHSFGAFNIPLSPLASDELVTGEDGTTKLWQDWVKAQGFFGPAVSADGLPPRTPNLIKAGLPEKDLSNKPNDTWVHVFFADGWTTGGGGNPRKKG